jgi:DNA-binding NtrC family response regulator
MNSKDILIADKDTESRQQVAAHFRDAGYQVETTDSAAHVLCTILEKHTPVIVLTDNFDRKVGSGELIRLLKQCNRQLAIILVSEEVPLPLERKLRQEGIFYHALKTETGEDTDEILKAVECAFDKTKKQH